MEELTKMTDLNLKEWRARHGNISQRQLSIDVDTCQEMISRYERGVTKMPRKFRLALAALAHGLDVGDVNGPKEGENAK